MAEVSGIGILFLAIFFFSLIGFYVAIRQRLLNLAPAAILCSATTIVALILFGLTNDGVDDNLALVGGFGVGLAFTGMMITMAAFFQNNEPASLAAYDAMLAKRDIPPDDNSQSSA